MTKMEETTHRDVGADRPSREPTVGGSSDREDYGAAEGAPERRSPWRAVAIIALVAAVLGAAVVWWIVARDRASDGPQPPLLESVVLDPATGAELATPWVDPSGVAVLGDMRYVLDSGNNRVLVLTPQGEVDGIFCERGDCAFLLDGPLDIEVDESRVYIANTGAGTVEVLDLSGAVVASYPLPRTEPDLSPRPSGLAVADDGTLYVSDESSGKVVRFGKDGSFLGYVGAPQIGDLVFDSPAGLDVDAGNNLYVAETGQGRIQKISPEGRPLTLFWMVPGSTNASRPVDVVVADDGTVYMADVKRSIVQVFSASARHMGILGLLDATRVDSPGALRNPVGLAYSRGADERVIVMDVSRGLQTYLISPGYWAWVESESGI